MTDSPWSAPDTSRGALEWEDVEARPRDTLGLVTGVLSIVFASLELLWALFALLVLVTFAFLVTMPGAPPEFTEMSGLMFGVYAVFFVGALVSGVAHLIAGIQLLRPDPNRLWIWASAAASVGSLMTFYCAPFGIALAVLDLVWLTRPSRQPAD